MTVKPKFRRSHVWAVLFTVAIAVWIGSGAIPALFGSLNGTETPTEPDTTVEEASLFRVEVTRFAAEPKHSVLRVRGRTEASRRVEVRARTPGIIEQVPLEDGARVGEGDILCTLDLGAREAQLAEERARMESARIDFEAADRLADQQFGSETRRASERAKYDAARAAVERMEREVAYTTITAPVDGIIEQRVAELGSFLQVGGHCATVIDLDPMLVVVHVGERSIAALSVGMSATAELVTGETVDGFITFISPAADEGTRTFRVELQVPNADLSLRDGITAEIQVPLQPRSAHHIPSSVLTLNDAGEIGVRTVDGEDVVRFRAVKILSQEREGAWVSGLERVSDVITTGQDYVLDGQRVEPVREGGNPAQ